MPPFFRYNEGGAKNARYVYTHSILSSNMPLL